MTYFVTGATGFIGRHLVERLLEHEGIFYLLVREGSADKLERWRGEERVKPVFGDLTQPQLGIDDAAREPLRGVDHFLHLGAIYDITADETQNALLNVGGTQNAVDLANALGAKRFHHMSSIAVAGDYDGWFTEDNFEEGQGFPTPYHRTKFESEKLVRERLHVPWRVYRPSLVDPKPPKSGDVLNAFANAAHAPHAVMRVDKKLTDMLPKGVLSYAMKIPALQGMKRSFLADLGIPEEAIKNAELRTRFDARDTQRALAGSAIELPPLESYATKLWDYWERNLDPDLFKDRSFEGAVNGRTVVITGASSGIGRAAAIKIAAAGGIPLLVARTQEKVEEVKAEIEAAGGTAYVYPCDLSDYDAIEELVPRMLADHPAIDMLVNNAGRSIRRSFKLSYDRFHDYERTVGLNYLSPVKLMLGLLPHMAERRSGHIVNVSSIGVQTNPPRFSAYVASKSALDAFTRVVSSETIGDNVTFTTIHMPLVRTAMIAPTKMYDSFPTISPEEAADLICEAIRAKPKQINTRLGTFGEVLYALAPKAVDQILHMAYKVFPESSAAKGVKDGEDRASGEATALAHLMRGVHW